MTPEQLAILQHPDAQAERPATSEIAWIGLDADRRVAAAEIIADFLQFLPPLVDANILHGVACDITRAYALRGYDHVAGLAALSMQEFGPGALTQLGGRGQYLMLDIRTGVLIKTPHWNVGFDHSNPASTVSSALIKAFDLTLSQLTQAVQSLRLLKLPYALAREPSRPPAGARQLRDLPGLGMHLALDFGLAVEATRFMASEGLMWCLSPALIGDGIQGDRGDEGKWYTLRKAEVVAVEVR